ncbi:hypothetical protein [Pseudofrankia sp. BMG5.36]|uniref:hypothetical protein n=1 Tax=Pseudofrankia sp. BMG5.36 TaxID=1834512 RepID=UPI0008DA1DEE|nr:hypothetical protein [Pseudofrankia sp. BMG5.36]OHV64182.1 hypothetical protein BCD48_37665 [Pseudofrankia sp. BMG5.36]
MNDATLSTALRWFPLIGWARLPCPPLPVRLAEIDDIVRNARGAGEDALTAASQALNLAALVASDCGLPDLAYALCWRHIDAYRHAPRPLTVPLAKRMLGPALNLIRLRLRAGQPDDALRLLDLILRAATTGADISLDGRALPLAGLIGTHDEHRELRQSVWRQCLTDGIRAHAMAGRWDQAAEFALHHRGVAGHLLEGRQAMIIAALLAGDSDAARELLTASTITERWERHVAACLTVMCAAPSDAAAAIDAMIVHFLDDNVTPDHIVFRVRLGLTVATLAACTSPDGASAVITRISDDILATGDGHAAHDILTTPMPALALAPRCRESLAELVSAAGLRRGALPPELSGSLDASVSAALALTDSHLRVPRTTA